MVNLSIILSGYSQIAQRGNTTNLTTATVAIGTTPMINKPMLNQISSMVKVWNCYRKINIVSIRNAEGMT